MLRTNSKKANENIRAYIKARFTEPEAERRLTWLIYRELSKAAAKREVKK